jgi:drug/metabolite transporter (DMT)-like permease
VSQKLKLSLVLVIGIVVISLASILIRWAQAEGAPSLMIAVYRLVTATLILSVPMVYQHGWQDYAKLGKGTMGLLVLSGVLLGLHFATWITSLAHVSVMISVVLVCTTPIWIGLASPLLLGERIPPLMWVSLAIVMVGVIVIGLGGWEGAQSRNLEGNLLALAGAVFGAGYLAIGRRVRAAVALVPYLWLVYGTAAVFLLVWSAANGLPIFGYTLTATLCMVGLGIGPQLIGHSSANYAMVLKELPSSLQIVGGVLTLAGIVSASWAESKTTSVG